MHLDLNPDSFRVRTLKPDRALQGTKVLTLKGAKGIHAQTLGFLEPLNPTGFKGLGLKVWALPIQ